MELQTCQECKKVCGDILCLRCEWALIREFEVRYQEHEIEAA